MLCIKMLVMSLFTSYSNKKVLNLEEGNKIKAVSPGECKVKISIDDNFYDDSTTTINVKVK